MQQFHRKVFRMLLFAHVGTSYRDIRRIVNPFVTDVRVIQVFVAGNRYLRPTGGDLVWPQKP